MDEDWGEAEQKPKSNAENQNKKEENNNRRQLLFGGSRREDEELDDIPTVGEGSPAQVEDKFNQVLSTSKENGGLLASIGLKKGDANDESIIDDSQEEDPHKKSDLFDTSKDKGGKKGSQKGMESEEDDFDLGFGSNKKSSKMKSPENDAELAGLGSDEEITEEQQIKAIEEQFQTLYDKDPELRKMLEKSDVSSFGVAEKLQIVEAYIQGGGAAGLQIELEDSEEDVEEAIKQMTEEEIQELEK